MPIGGQRLVEPSRRGVEDARVEPVELEEPEHLVFHEIRSYLQYAGVKGSLGYWATPSGSEVDFVWWHGTKRVAIDVKHGSRYRADYRKGIASLLSSTRVESYIVYLGEREMDVEGTRVLPADVFFRRLHAGQIVGS